MILEKLENCGRFVKVNSGFAKALDFLGQADLEQLAEGKYEIDGDRVFAMVVRAEGRSADEAELEIHRKYIDIQYMINGTELIGWKPLADCSEPIGEYNAENDIQFFKDQSDCFVQLNAGSAAVFFPEDAHMPLIGEGRKMHKVIVKVLV
jgi:YhcH/YjgK/YiaL family protein